MQPRSTFLSLFGSVSFLFISSFLFIFFSHFLKSKRAICRFPVRTLPVLLVLMRAREREKEQKKRKRKRKEKRKRQKRADYRHKFVPPNTFLAQQMKPGILETLFPFFVSVNVHKTPRFGPSLLHCLGNSDEFSWAFPLSLFQVEEPASLAGPFEPRKFLWSRGGWSVSIVMSIKVISFFFLFFSFLFFSFLFFFLFFLFFSFLSFFLMFSPPLS